MEKYYSPTIEELLTEVINNGDVYGFVYNTDTLLQIKFDLPIENSLKYFIENGNKNNEIYSLNLDIYKLKCLDRDDIESMGFEYDKNISEFDYDCYTFDKGLDSKKRYIQYILLDYHNGNIYLEKTINCSGNEIGFLTIKNKSELKVLLKTLGI